MTHFRSVPIVAVLAMASLAACAPQDPPTITAPPPDAGAMGSNLAPGQSIEITMPPPDAPRIVPTVVAQPLTIDARERYVDAERAFSIDVPVGWEETRQEIAAGANDVQLGTVFASPENSGLLSITQFDNGQRPASLGVTTNQVLKLTGWTDLPDFQELRRENVIQREGEALRIDATYTRNNGIAMRSLVLFQIDGTTFSMVNLGVERGSFNENEGVMREILDTYRVPGVGQAEAADGGEEASHDAPAAGEAGDDAEGDAADSADEGGQADETEEAGTTDEGSG